MYEVALHLCIYIYIYIYIYTRSGKEGSRQRLEQCIFTLARRRRLFFESCCIVSTLLNEATHSRLKLRSSTLCSVRFSWVSQGLGGAQSYFIGRSNDFLHYQR